MYIEAFATFGSLTALVSIATCWNISPDARTLTLTVKFEVDYHSVIQNAHQSTCLVQ